MRNSNDQTRYEKETTTEPNRVGEASPALGYQSKGWESLKEVPFRGNQNAFTRASSGQGQNNTVVTQRNAIIIATPEGKRDEVKANTMTHQRSR